MSKEAMKLALEALEKMARLTGPQWSLENNYVGHLETLTALREALAEQPAQQEPVAKVWTWHKNGDQHAKLDDWGLAIASLPDGMHNLYTTPQAPAAREWAGLTDEEFQCIYDHGRTPAGMMEMVEAKLKEKNHD